MPIYKLHHTALATIKPSFKLQTLESIDKMVELIITEANADKSVKVYKYTNQIKLLLPFMKDIIGAQ